MNTSNNSGNAPRDEEGLEIPIPNISALTKQLIAEGYLPPEAEGIVKGVFE